MYGLLCYNNSYNLGDNVQSIAAMQYLPQINVWIDRDTHKVYDYITNEEIQIKAEPAPILHKSPSKTKLFDKIKHKVVKQEKEKQENINKEKEETKKECKSSKFKKYKVIYNGWFDSHYCKFPPPEYIDPIMVSFHINDEDHSSDPRYKVMESSLIDYRPITSYRSYLLEHGPIGCRDLYTKNMLDAFNIPAYFSACLTLTLKRPVVQPTNDIVVIDAHNIETDAVFIKLPAELRQRAIYVSQAVETPTSNVDKMRLANELLTRIASAKLIITNRLHSLLPALAFHVPVLFITNDAKNPRFAGLLCCPIYDGKKEFNLDINMLTWDYMVQNHGVAELLGHAQKMKDVIQRQLRFN